MPDYTPPIPNMMRTLDLIGLPDTLDSDMAEAILNEAGKLARDVLAPLNWEGDQFGAKLEGGKVTTAPGFQDGYTQYRDNGWNAVPFPEQYGGQDLPWLLAFPIQEMWQAANLSFGLCPLLNQGAIHAILAHGSAEQKQQYLPKLISGEWTGTMNLTEPQAGSDLGTLKTKAIPQKDGSYKISGQKIYITYGEHDLADNIIHLVLARTPDAPEGSRGISLFIVPKILEDGTRNDVICTSLEHKLGIHASPTCTMQFGDQGGATGYLLGEENKGLTAMFTMMNNARLSVGLQGVAIMDRATQAAKAYASERVQGRAIDGGTEAVTIDQHPDVQNMLHSMEATTHAGRILCYLAAAQMDKAEHNGDKEAQAVCDLLTPIVKSWCTDQAVEITSIGVQVHGGMGFVEETGAAQYYRDARILPIYEGTNGIQAADLLFRKILKDNGKAAKAYIAFLKDKIPEPGKDVQTYATQMDKTDATSTPDQENADPDSPQDTSHSTPENSTPVPDQARSITQNTHAKTVDDFAPSSSQGKAPLHPPIILHNAIQEMEASLRLVLSVAARAQAETETAEQTGENHYLRRLAGIANPLLNQFGIVSAAVMLSWANDDLAEFYIKHHLPHATAYAEVVKNALPQS